MSSFASTVEVKTILALLKRLLVQSFLAIVLVLAYAGFGLAEPQFHSLANLINILKQSSYLVMLATAQMIVLITRGFDLSVGTVIGMISVASSLVMVAVLSSSPESVGLAILLGCLVGLGIGFAVGAINGFAVAVLRVNPFVTTLGMMGIALGFASTLSGGFPVFDVPETLMDVLSRGNWLGVPAPIAVCMMVLAGVYFLLRHTVFGRSLYLLGSNERAAHVAGLPTQFHLACAYVVCSLIVAIVALMLTARSGTGEPRVGVVLMFESLMAAIIGGVSLGGGEGRILHCIVGGLFVTILGNGMNLVRVDSNIQMIVLGIALIGAIFVDRFRARVR
jgi:ribose/xylose/arabinose/galactoside ABC-type transport system permease subunit